MSVVQKSQFNVSELASSLNLCNRLIAVVILLAFLFPLVGQAGNFRIGKVLGKTYAGWLAEWGQWAEATGFSQFNDGYVDCADGQKGAVWFLGGTFSSVTEPGNNPEVRPCIELIPRGKTLILTPLNFLFFNPDDACPEDQNFDCTVAQRRELANGFFSDQIPGNFLGDTETYGCQVSVTLDGTPVGNLGIPIARTQTPTFPFFVRDEEPENPDLSNENTIVDGYVVALPRLRAGEHEIRFTGGVCPVAASPAAILAWIEDPNCQSCVAPLFLFDVTYILTVGQ